MSEQTRPSALQVAENSGSRNDPCAALSMDTLVTDPGAADVVDIRLFLAENTRPTARATRETTDVAVVSCHGEVIRGRLWPQDEHQRGRAIDVDQARRSA